MKLLTDEELARKKERQRSYYRDNRERVLEYQRRYREMYPDKIRERRDARRVLARAHNRVVFRRFQEWLQVMTATHPCVLCGSRADLWHHVDPFSKRCDMASMHSHSLDSIEAELEKCVAMCRQCHSRYHNAKAVA